MSSMTGHFNMGRTFPIYFSSATTLAANEFDHAILLVGSGAQTLTLPLLAACPNGYKLIVKNNSAFSLIVAGNGTDQIGAVSSITLSTVTGAAFIVDHVNSNWQQI